MKQLGIFAKYWQPGEVKTRLASSVGHETASRIYRSVLETSLERLSHFADRRVLCFSPPERRAEFEHLAGERWTVEAQSPGDLGQRMEAYFDIAFKRGADSVILVGSDTPTLPLKYVESALALLADHDAVLGPAADGGYYLIGASKATPRVFDGVAWGTPQVWEQTATRLGQAGFRWASLPSWYDVDRPDDLVNLANDLKQRRAAEPALERLWQSLVSELPPEVMQT